MAQVKRAKVLRAVPTRHVATPKPVRVANFTADDESQQRPVISPISSLSCTPATDSQANVFKPTIMTLDVDRWIYRWGFWQYKLVVQTALRQEETYVCRFSSLQEATKAILEGINTTTSSTPPLTESDEEPTDCDPSPGTQEQHMECCSGVRFELPDSTVPKFPQTHWCTVGKWCDTRAVTEARVVEILKVLHYIELHSADAHFALHTKLQKLPLATQTTTTEQK